MCLSELGFETWSWSAPWWWDARDALSKRVTSRVAGMVKAHYSDHVGCLRQKIRHLIPSSTPGRMKTLATLCFHAWYHVVAIDSITRKPLHFQKATVLLVPSSAKIGFPQALLPPSPQKPHSPPLTSDLHPRLLFCHLACS